MCSIKEAVLKKFAKFTEKHLCWNIFFIKKRIPYRCFPMNFWKLLAALSFIEHLGTTASVNLYPLDCLLLSLTAHYWLQIHVICTIYIIIMLFATSVTVYVMTLPLGQLLDTGITLKVFQLLLVEVS